MAVPVPSRPVASRFGRYTVDMHAGELRKNGTRVKLQERPFQILGILLERPGEVVTREELRSRLWPDGTFVDFDHSISSAIRKLRDALCAPAATPRYIETVGRRGYRFIDVVENLSAPQLLASAPIVQFGSYPIGNRSNVASLAHQINNGPVLFALLEMIQSQSYGFMPP
jgi:DNA-binding winged helix-turn-helix (wHTH) protein